jgi:D-arabinose 1-dehydrogenase-like Zn-dependent alcohol dehydrogenase
LAIVCARKIPYLRNQLICIEVGVQYAKAMGMRVIAVDGGDDKKKLCSDLGAEKYIDFTQEKDITGAESLCHFSTWVTTD